MFFGVAEPVMHYLMPPTGMRRRLKPPKEAMRLTFSTGAYMFGHLRHRSINSGVFSYRHGLPLTLRSALYPIIMALFIPYWACGRYFCCDGHRIWCRNFTGFWCSTS